MQKKVMGAVGTTLAFWALNLLAMAGGGQPGEPLDLFVGDAIREEIGIGEIGRLLAHWFSPAEVDYIVGRLAVGGDVLSTARQLSWQNTTELAGAAEFNTQGQLQTHRVVPRLMPHVDGYVTVFSGSITLTDRDFRYEGELTDFGPLASPVLVRYGESCTINRTFEVLISINDQAIYVEAYSITTRDIDGNNLYINFQRSSKFERISYSLALEGVPGTSAPRNVEVLSSGYFDNELRANTFLQTMCGINSDPTYNPFQFAPFQLGQEG